MSVRCVERLLIVLVVLVSSLAGQTARAALPQPWKAQPRFEYRDARTALADRLGPAEPAAAPGFAVVLLREGRPILERYSGVESLETGAPIGPNTRFYIASVGKSITATAALMLYEQGKLRLEDPLSRYIPGLPPCARGILIHHLLNHTSGLPDYYDALGERVPGIDNARVVRFAREIKRLDFEPGVQYEYSNTGYVLLAEVIERASGETYEKFVTGHLFEPLGMTQSVVIRRGTPDFPHRARGYRSEDGAWVADDYEDQYTVGSGGIYSTTGDLLRWYRAVVDSRLLKPATTALMFDTAPTLSGDRSYLAMGWSDETLGPKTPDLEGLRSFAAFGMLRGFRALVQTFPDQDLAFIVLSNAGRLPLMGGEVAAMFFRRVPYQSSKASPTTGPSSRMLCSQ